MSSILLVLPVPYRHINGALHIESQAANGLDRWADNFDRVVAACPVIPEAEADKRSSWKWVHERSLAQKDRIRLVGLPWARTPGSFLANCGEVRRSLLHKLISESNYLQFAIGGLIGDWPSVAALEARRMNRAYSVWTDRVESEVVRITAAQHSMGKRQLSFANAWLMKRYEHHIIRNAQLGLFHGAETFHAYSGLPRHAFLTHDVHTKKRDLISPGEVANKVASASDVERPLRIGYAGRASAMKAPLDWLNVLVQLRAMGVAYEATWLGDGEMLPDMHAFVTSHSLGGHVAMPGFVSDRDRLLSFLRSCDVLLFTHITPESPRIILESLVSGTPVVGYANGYVADVVAVEDRRLLAPLGDTAQIAEIIAGLARNRKVLAEAIRSAARTGEQFNDVAVFRHRSELIKQYL